MANAKRINLDAIDELNTKTSQLSALLHTLYGHGWESFRSYNETIQENVLWLASDLASDVDKLGNRLFQDEPSP